MEIEFYVPLLDLTVDPVELRKTAWMVLQAYFSGHPYVTQHMAEQSCRIVSDGRLGIESLVALCVEATDLLDKSMNERMKAIEHEGDRDADRR